MATVPRKSHCPSKARFSVTVIKPGGLPSTVWSCTHHISGTLLRETCAIANSSGGRPAIVLPVKPLHRCDTWAEAASG